MELRFVNVLCGRLKRNNNNNKKDTAGDQYNISATQKNIHGIARMHDIICTVPMLYSN